MSQDYLQYTMPLDNRMCPLEGPRSCCLDMSSLKEVSAVPLPGASDTFSKDDSHVDQDLVVGPESLVDSLVNNLLIGTTGVMFQSPRGGHDDAPPLSPLLSPMQNNPIQRNFSSLSGPDLRMAKSVHCHLNFDPNSAPRVARVYDLLQVLLKEELKKLAKQGWYWGPITCWEAEGKLANMPDDSFLVQDSSDDHYHLSLRFRSHD